MGMLRPASKLLYKRDLAENQNQDFLKSLRRFLEKLQNKEVLRNSQEANSQNQNFDK